MNDFIYNTINDIFNASLSSVGVSNDFTHFVMRSAMRSLPNNV